MKNKILKKLISALCAATMSVSVVAPTGAIKYSGTFQLNSQQNTYITQLNNKMENMVATLNKTNQNIQRRSYNNQIKQNLSLNINNITSNLKNIYNLYIPSRGLIGEIGNKINEIEKNISDALNILNSQNCNIYFVGSQLFEINKKAQNLYTYIMNKMGMNNMNMGMNNMNMVNMVNMVNMMNMMNKVKMMNNILNNPEPVNPEPVNPEPIDQNEEQSSREQKWWNKAEGEINNLIDEAKSKMANKEVSLDNAKKKFKNLFAGYQSPWNCWLFSAQNIANYFLSLNGQQPIVKHSDNIKGSRDAVEMEFMERLKGKKFDIQIKQGNKKIHKMCSPVELLNNAQDHNIIGAYLETYGIQTNAISVYNDEPNNKKRANIMEKLAYLMLVRHFSFSNTPVIVNVGWHWVTIAGIDRNSNSALVLDSMQNGPEIRSLKSITHNISTVMVDGENRIEMLFPKKSTISGDNICSFGSWSAFKSQMLRVSAM